MTIVTRGIAAIYVLAFVSAANQWRGLLGDDGLLPARRAVESSSFARSPTLFHWRYSDDLAVGVAWTGAGLAALLALGLPQGGPVWLAPLTWFVVWALYLSLVSVGRQWYAFGWESLTLEAGFLAVFVGPDWLAPPTVVVWLFRWLVFRVEFGAGMIKLRGDECWRDLTCLYYHHETQPLPNPVSWFVHRLPEPLHRVEVGANHVAQLIAPFGLFAPQPVAGIAGAAIVVTQLWLVATGNFAWLNAITIVLAFSAFGDPTLEAVTWLSPPEVVASVPLAWQVVVLLGAALLVGLSWWPLRNLLSRGQRMNFSFNPFHLVNAYGAFGSITRRRFELVIEGTRDEDPGPDSDWREYGFRAKPGDPQRPPPQVAPYHLRLDWLLWFAAMSPVGRHPWMLRLVGALLAGNRAVLALLRRDPFGGDPPRYVRVRRYLYRFSTRQERSETGAWWVRELQGEYLPALSADDVDDARLRALG